MVLGHPAQEQGCLATAGATPPLPAVPGPLSLQSVVHWLTRRLCLSSGRVRRKASRERRPPGRASLACSSSPSTSGLSETNRGRNQDLRPGQRSEQSGVEEASAALTGSASRAGPATAMSLLHSGAPSTGWQLCPGDTAQADVCLPAGLPPPTPERLSSVC